MVFNFQYKKNKQMALEQGSIGSKILLEDLISGLRPSGILKQNLEVGESINQSTLDNPVTKFNYKGTYIVDLSFWGIDENSTPLETTVGLNNLFKWAIKSPALTTIVFPKNYKFTLDVIQDLVYSRDSTAVFPHYFAIVIQNLHNVDINLNGSTFTLIPNAITRYQIFFLEDCTNIRINDGKLIGERIEHDYTTNPIPNTDHEHGHGILGRGANKNIELRNLLVKRVMGYGIAFYFNEPVVNTIFNNSINLDNIEEGDIDSFGNEIADPTKTRTEFRTIAASLSEVEDFYLAGLGFFSANGIRDNAEIIVYFYDENDVYITNSVGVEGSKITRPEGAAKFRMTFDQPLIATNFFLGGIDDNGVDRVLTVTENNANNSARYGRTDLIEFTDEQIQYGFHHPDSLKEITTFNYGSFVGEELFYYDDTDTFLEKKSYPTDIISIPATATKYRIFARQTPYNEWTSRFLIFLSPVKVSENVSVKNCILEENRAMGLAGVYNGLTVENTVFTRNGVTIQGNTKERNLGYGIDLEEGHKINKNITINKCKFVKNFEGGILFYPLDNLIITNNYFDERANIIFPKINKVTLDNNTFVNHEKGDIPVKFNNTNATYINSRIDKTHGTLSNGTFINCFIEGKTAASNFATESVEEIVIHNSKFIFTNDFSKPEFIIAYAKTKVTLKNCEIINQGDNSINLIRSTTSGAVNPLTTVQGLIIDNCKVDGLRISENSRISKIINSEISIPLSFNASIADSPLSQYGGLELRNNNKFDLQPKGNDTSGTRFRFDTPVKSQNNFFTYKGVQFIAAGTYMFDFDQGLESRNDVFISTSPTALRFFRTNGDVKFIKSEVRAENASALIEHNGTLEEFQALYSPAKQ